MSDGDPVDDRRVPPQGQVLPPDSEEGEPAEAAGCDDTASTGPADPDGQSASDGNARDASARDSMARDSMTLGLDADVIEQAKGDPQAFALLYERFVDRIYNYIYYRVGNRHDAEDLTSRTFQRALANVRTFESRGVPVSAWFYRIAHNLVANWHRDRSRRQTIALDDLVSQPASGELPVAAAVSEERRRVLLHAVRQLPAERQQLLILKFNEQMSNAEIGEVMGRTESAIKSLYHRTLLALREQLAGQGIGPEDAE